MRSWKMSSLRLASVLMFAALVSACKAAGPEMEVRLGGARDEIIIQSRDNQEFAIKRILVNRGNSIPDWHVLVVPDDFMRNAGFQLDPGVVVSRFWFPHNVQGGLCDKEEGRAILVNAKVGIFLCLVEPKLKFGGKFAFGNFPDKSIIEVEIITNRGSRVFTFK